MKKIILYASKFFWRGWKSCIFGDWLHYRWQANFFLEGYEFYHAKKILGLHYMKSAYTQVYMVSKMWWTLANWQGLILLLHDNARPHVARMTLQKLNDLGYKTLPPYSPDFASTDYQFCKYLDKFLSQKTLQTRCRNWFLDVKTFKVLL